MAETSTTNLITAINKTLENIGERKVANLNSPVARKCYEALCDSLEDISNANDWEWSREVIPAVSWTGDTANLGDVHRIHGVSVGSTTDGYVPLPHISLQSFDMYPILSYTSELERPSFYCISSYNKVRVNPYPADSLTQARFKFYVTQSWMKPVNLTDFFPIPERFMPLLFLRAQHMMAINHLDDADGAALFARQYDSLLQRLRDRERLSPSGGTSTFKLRARRGRL